MISRTTSVVNQYLSYTYGTIADEALRVVTPLLKLLVESLSVEAIAYEKRGPSLGILLLSSRRNN